MDLLDWYRGRLTSRRLAVLVKHMPRDSAIAQELHGDGAEWKVGDYLLAAAVDHLAAANWMFASVNTDEDSDPPEPPVPVPRPGDGDGPAEPSVEDSPPPGGPSRAELMHFFS
ncbi:hypothetical protein CP967_13535 [Streptomyces nitrosporeus]|uniref:Uncharacterized protein n=1 Tax=Streptomyces nitrosporeus TaxID=28894 RepID=A0A5J6F8R7_9ACTN|nr:hypothetical protein [Streptomyces nitrosporeus]QEU72889.1 hypothetical protein CP967_13535 [Streptomyces nitrosporeus]GGZ13383.1 hypothetical protein GCM10010327_50410 [Streptomyces nitrosporeus]